jgi:ribosomal protein L40E
MCTKGQEGLPCRLLDRHADTGLIADTILRSKPMIVCKHCGGQNPDGTDFCGSCGKFLEWSGERVQPASPQPSPPSPSPPAPTPSPPPPTLVEKVKHAVGIEPGTTPQATPNAGAERESAPPHQPAPAPDPDSSPRSRLPQAEVEQRHVTAQPPPPRIRARPGDLICGQCGMPNDPVRHFCRRCGSSLDEAVVVRTPWWRRLLPRRRQVAAGERPGRAGRAGGSAGAGAGATVARTLRAVVAVAAVLAVLAYALLPGLREGVNTKAITLYQQARLALNLGALEPVHPTQANASSSVPGHGPELLIDLVKNDYWAAEIAQDPQPKIVLTFPTATDLGAMVVTSGAGPDFLKLGRPKDVLLTYSDGSTQQLTLADDGKSITHVLHGRHVSTLTIQVLSVYPGQQSTAVAISELEFFRIK